MATDRHHLPIVRPQTVGDCRGGVRPCPWVSCRYNLLIDVLDDGCIVINAPSTRLEGASRPIAPSPKKEALFLDEVDDAIEHWFDEPDPNIKSCLMDEVARLDRINDDDHQLEEIAEILGVTRERARQIEVSGRENFARELKEAGIDPSVLESLIG